MNGFLRMEKTHFVVLNVLEIWPTQCTSNHSDESGFCKGKPLAARLRDFLSEHINDRRGPPKQLARTSSSRPTRYVISANMPSSHAPFGLLFGDLAISQHSH